MTDLLTLDEVGRAAGEALTNCGASDLQAVALARSIRAAEAEGARDIGLVYLPFHCQHHKVGKIAGNAQPSATRPAPGLVRMDAANGFALTAYEAGRAGLTEPARSEGIAAMGITDAYACGLLDYFTDALG